MDTKLRMKTASLRIMVASEKEADACRILTELERGVGNEIRVVSCNDALDEAWKDIQPDIVVAHPIAFSLSFLKEIRERHPKDAFVLIQDTSIPMTFGKGINICIWKREICRLGPWMGILSAVKRGDVRKDCFFELRKKIVEAVAEPEEKIYSATLDSVRIKDRRAVLAAGVNQ